MTGSPSPGTRCDVSNSKDAGRVLGVHGVVMRISAGEQQAIKQVVAAGELYGFGNMISHLATAWAKSLMTKWGMSEESARAGAWGLNGYPFKMQEDLIDRGEWDESGQAYSA